MVDLLGSSCVVFGASGGLGSKITEELAAKGAKTSLVGRNFSRLAAVEAEGPRIEADLRDPEAADRAMQVTADTFGGLDIVVNAVGVVAFGGADELDVDVLEELFLTNTFAPIFMAKAALRHLRPGGVIVNISGVIAEQNLPNMAAYGASKAALKAWDDGFRREARRAKIQVLNARPGHTETGLATRALAGASPKFPQGLSPEHVASVIVKGIVENQTELPSSAF